MPFENLSPVLADALAARGYEGLTPVQTHVVEAQAIGRDLLVSAQTGSGKTVAFGLAMAEHAPFARCIHAADAGGDARARCAV